MSSTDSSTHILWHGAPAAPPSPQWLVAGPLTVALEEGQLRGIWLGSVQLVQRIYGAVRDRFWNTVPGVITDLHVEQTSASFRVTFTSTHSTAEVDFVWRAEITGTEDGALTYVFDGEARREMAKNRIGLCLLHPLWLAGKSARLEYVSGDRAAVKFPESVDPMQPVRGLHDFRELQHEAVPGVDAVLSFTGDMFEIEDQRNWTDASFKSYSTPQRIPLPATMYAGQRVQQRITLRLTGETAALPAGAPPADALNQTVRTGAVAGTLPEIGTGTSYHGAALTESELARLRPLQLAHYRVELDTAAPAWADILQRGLTEAAQLGARAEIVLPVADDAAAVCEAALAVAARHPGRVARWLVLSRGAPATRAPHLETARAVLSGSGAPVGGGTDADFFQLNNNRIPAAACDFVSVPLRPCAHQFDLSMMAINLQGQREVLRTMAGIWPDKPLVVSPVSLRTRAQKGPVAGPGELPSQADVRQMSLAGAAWTLGCLKAVAESGARSVTLFQATGLRGLMERDGGSGVPEFHSTPGTPYPLSLVLAAVAGWSGAEVLSAETDCALTVQALVLRRSGKQRAILANFTAVERTVSAGASYVSGKVLHAGNAAAAVQAPDAAAWWTQDTIALTTGAVTLPAFGVAVLDAAPAA